MSLLVLFILKISDTFLILFVNWLINLTTFTHTDFPVSQTTWKFYFFYSKIDGYDEDLHFILYEVTGSRHETSSD